MGISPGSTVAMTVMAGTSIHMLGKVNAFANGKGLAGMCNDTRNGTQAWKIRKLCKIVGRTDATELIAGLRSVREASGIIDQLQALEAEQKNRAAAQ